MNFAGVAMVKEPTFCPSNDIHAFLEPSWFRPGQEEECSDMSPRPTHPRPYDHDLCEAEGRRRTELDLKGSEDNSACHRPDSPASLTSNDEVPNRTISTPSLHSSSSLASPIGTTRWDGNAEVDDSFWTYDMVEFMARRRLNPSWDRYTRAEQALVPQNELPPSPITSEVSSSRAHSPSHDVQGIDWPKYRLTRQVMLNERRRCYPFLDQSAGTIPRTDTHVNEEEYHYRFSSFIPKADPPKFSHCQLRSMLVGNRRSDIYYAARDKIYRTQAHSPAETPIIDFQKMNFRISTLALTPTDQPAQILVAGSLDGDYALHPLFLSPSCAPTIVSNLCSTPNSLINHISPGCRSSGTPTIVFATNDSQLRVLDLPTNTPIQSLRYPHAINATATSPDTRLRILVGDSNDVLLTSSSTGEILQEMKGHKNDGFACAWANDGVTIVTGAEDGLVKLWDARMLRWSVTDLECVMGCARTLEFTDSDVLVIGEGEDGVTFWDGRRTVRQDVRFFGCVAGVAVLDGGEEIVVANGDRVTGGLLAFERSDQGYKGETLGALVV